MGLVFTLLITLTILSLITCSFRLCRFLLFNDRLCLLGRTLFELHVTLSDRLKQRWRLNRHQNEITFKRICKRLWAMHFINQQIQVCWDEEYLFFENDSQVSIFTAIHIRCHIIHEIKCQFNDVTQFMNPCDRRWQQPRGWVGVHASPNLFVTDRNGLKFDSINKQNSDLVFTFRPRNLSALRT